MTKPKSTTRRSFVLAPALAAVRGGMGNVLIVGPKSPGGPKLTDDAGEGA